MKRRTIAIVIIILILGFGLIFNELTSKKEDAVEWSETITQTQTTTFKKATKKKVKKKKKKSSKKIKQKHSKDECKQFAYNELVNRYHWSEKDWNALVNLWNKESGWNASSRNKRSGACGIPQALPCSKMKTYGKDYKTNCYTQINWGLGYIAYRYGNPSKAWKHFNKKGWY